MSPLEQYQHSGLATPIRFHSGKKLAFLIKWGGGFLIFGSVVALFDQEPYVPLVGVFGLLFFGTCLYIMQSTVKRSKSRGMVEISEEGIYMAHIDMVLPWKDLGPAWSFGVKIAFVNMRDIFYAVKNISTHQKEMTRYGKWLLKVSRWTAKLKHGEAINWGLNKLISTAALPVGMKVDDYDQQLKLMKKAINDDPDAAVFNIPSFLTWETTTEGLMEIINHEVLIRNGDSAGILTKERSNQDFEEKLRSLHRLFQDGILTEKEYQLKKEEILKEA
ncbi:SHOCT domain-containing protein [Verrucomicrobiaceae bacterium 227]